MVQAEIIDRSLAFDHVIEALSLAGHGDTELHAFTRAFLSRIDEAEFAGLDARNLAILVYLAWDFIKERKTGTAKIRAYDQNDDVTARGGITVIEMVNDDMPFLLDSVLSEVQNRGLMVKRVIHPVLNIKRDDSGRLLNAEADDHPGDSNANPESLIQIHIDRLVDVAAKKDLCDALNSILDNVHTVVADWREMMDRLERTMAAYTKMPPPVAVADLAESIQFLRWLMEDNFTFLGMRAYDYIGEESEGGMKPVPGSGLGILRPNDIHVLRRGGEMVHMTPEVRKFFLAPALLIITKANMVSTVHRRVHMDYIGVKIYSENGDISGELRIVGLFTSTAYTRSVTSIPFVRHKADLILRRAGHIPRSHSHKALLNVLENFPRDELFQIEQGLLYRFIMDIHSLELRPRTHVLTRVDEFDRFVSVLVYVLRDQFSTDVRKAIGEYLSSVYKGAVSAYYPFFPDGQLVRLHFIIGRYEGKTPCPDQDVIIKRIRAIVQTWDDVLKNKLAVKLDNGRANEIMSRYTGAFPAGYEENFDAERAMLDIGRFDALTNEVPVDIDFYRDETTRAPERTRVAIYHHHGPIPLSRRVPIFENLGFSVIDERSYRILPKSGGNRSEFSLHDMILEVRDGAPVDLKTNEKPLEDAFLAVWRERTGNDDYNGLILKIDMDWREAAMLRSYGAYLRQIQAPFSHTYLCRTLITHHQVTGDLIALFRKRFDPTADISPAKRDEKETKIIQRIETALEKIPSLDEDRILRRFLNLICSTTRTNYYMRDGEGRPPETIAFKFDSGRIDGAPEPRPFAEIFVFSPRLQGIHLRGGPIARGGLRWSDRPQDFRTEVLGLAKAQQVKNAVIVPAGSKGGFIPRNLPVGGTREDIMTEGIACYQMFISTLLSLTDNTIDGRIVPPQNVVRHDTDDPYLVVAADKGTASFSDLANKISGTEGFWLDDAFASGGSAGYDHKKMGITARGGWEAVKRHFRETNVDIQRMPFTVIGVGDMSGDVFGNGMLLSPHIRLLAAFDHRDIFIDPDPDPAASFKERKRLFELARSSWQDFDTGVISAGGGIFSRAAKSISLSKEIRNLTGLNTERITPAELIRALLASPADLLWFGGIGTYVRESLETDAEAGDRVNDALRVTAQDLKVKVVGEGANLGMTQRARIEFAKAGGRINTDAIDNSAGVNSSDLEVNIKIVLSAAMVAGRLERNNRNAVLQEMTEEVAARCLRNSYLQTLALSLGEMRGLADLGFQQRLMHALERTGLLDRTLEFLPSDSNIIKRRKQGQALSRPELAVLLAYAKIDLFDKLIESRVPDDPYLTDELMYYFPKTLRDHFADDIVAHRLKREIIATQLSNAVINHGGSTMIVRLKEETGHNASDITRAFIITRAVLGVQHIYDLIDALDNKIPGQTQLDLYLEIQDLIRQLTGWFLRHVAFSDGLAGIIDRYRKGMGEITKSPTAVLTPNQYQRLEEKRAAYVEIGVPAKLAGLLSDLMIIADGPDIIYAARHLKRPVAEIAGLYFEIGDHFRINELKTAGAKLAISDYYDRLAINATLESLSSAERALTMDVVANAAGKAPTLADWLESNSKSAARTRYSLVEMLDGGALTLSKFMVAVNQLRALAPS
ncbi:MAG: NAD-glutamate dehydrogenase [bacterium]|nr:NAD-glutamate dehydrogenase [bacterium]